MFCNCLFHGSQTNPHLFFDTSFTDEIVPCCSMSFRSKGFLT